MATSIRESSNLMETGAAIMNQKQILPNKTQNLNHMDHRKQSYDRFSNDRHSRTVSSHIAQQNIQSPMSNALNSHANKFNINESNAMNNTGRYSVGNYKGFSSLAPPKKQGKMFHINLGQNDGPYKRTEIYGQPHVDKFASTSILKDQKKQGGARIAILGGTTFAANEDNKNRSAPDEPSNSVNKQIKRIEEQLVVGYEILAQFKTDSEELRMETDILMNDLINKVEAVQNHLSPDLYNDYKLLKGHMKEQKEDNEIAYKDLLKLKRETDSSKTKITACMERINQLEAHVGIMANNPNYFPVNEQMPTNLKQVPNERTHAE